MPFVAASGETLAVLQSILNNCWSVIQALFSGVTNVVAGLTANPLLLIPTGVALAFAIVKIFRRFIVSI